MFSLMMICNKPKTSQLKHAEARVNAKTSARKHVTCIALQLITTTNRRSPMCGRLWGRRHWDEALGGAKGADRRR